MSLPEYIRPVMFVGGKGGVGKTTVASALALKLAAAGRRVLVVSTDPAHSLGDMFGTDMKTGRTTLVPGLDGEEINSDLEADRYIDRIREQATSVARGALAQEVDRQIGLARHAPGAIEAALVERTARILAEEAPRYDNVVFDTAPTGHAMRLLALPELLARWTDNLMGHYRKMERMDAVSDFLGARSAMAVPDNDETADNTQRARMSRQIAQSLQARSELYNAAAGIMTDTGRACFIAVATPERLPVLEVRRIADFLSAHGLLLGAIVMNKILPESVDGDFMHSRKTMEDRYMTEIAGAYDCRIVRLVLRETEILGIESIRQIATRL